MSPLVFVGPLLVAHLVTPAREVRGHGVVAHASSTEIDVRANGRTQRIHLEPRDLSPEMTIQSVEIVDANFDGAPDIIVLREFGAKWGASDVFLWDGHRFTKDTPLARTLSRLPNVMFDAKTRTVSTRSIGPSNPSRVTYAVDAGALREIASCRFLNPASERVGTLVRTSHGHTKYTKVTLGPAEQSPCD
ncbi:MAG TPA: hypothetical protein VGH87_18085 [Polyangiaceae bacterium]